MHWKLYKLQEEDHRRALDKIQQLRDGRIRRAPQIIEGNYGFIINICLIILFI